MTKKRLIKLNPSYLMNTLLNERLTRKYATSTFSVRYGKKNIKPNDSGFSLLELIAVIAIMSILVSLSVAFYFHYAQKAVERKAMINAKTLYKSARLAVTAACADKGTSFDKAIKFQKEIDGQTYYCGRFTNQSMIKYLKSQAGMKSQTGASKDADQYIASLLIDNIPGTPSDLSSGTLVDKAPIQDSAVSTKEVADHPETWGKTVFAFCYTEKGDILYFQCLFDGYFVDIEQNGEAVVNKASDDYKFNNWPTSGKDRRTDVDTTGW